VATPKIFSQQKKNYSRGLSNEGSGDCAQWPGQPAAWVERRVRKVYDRHGRNWQKVVFLRRVSPAAVLTADANAGRPEMPCLALLRAAREGLGRVDLADACSESEGLWLPVGAEPEPASVAALAAAHARLADATRLLFAPHAVAARAIMTAGGPRAGGGIDSDRGGVGMVQGDGSACGLRRS
jgi:hypothetical protein